MKIETYFAKYGKIYGVSYKYNFGRWTGYIECFESLESAREWLYSEEYDFRTRELGSYRACRACID